MKTVIILGAGASVEFFEKYKGNYLSTQALTKALSEDLDDLYNYLITNRIYDEKRIPFIKEFVTEVVLSLRKYFKDTYNFEHIIHIVDILVDIFTSKNLIIRDNKNKLTNNIYLPLLDIFGTKFESYWGDILYYLPVYIRYFILDYVNKFLLKFRHYYDKTDFEIWKNFLLKLLNEGEVSIFSLNYDILLYEVIAELNKENKNNEKLYIETGVNFEDLALNNGCDILDLEKIKAAKNVFVPIHGSTLFVPENNNVKICRNANWATEERLRIITSMQVTSEGCNDYNQVMITGLSKFDALSKEPFATFYIRLIKDLIEANRIFVIGYSGADKHLNMLLKSSFCNVSEIHNITKLNEKEYGNLLDNLSEHIFSDWRKFLPENCFKKENLNQIISDKIIMKDGCYIYPKGTKYFLNNLEMLI